MAVAQEVKAGRGRECGEPESFLDRGAGAKRMTGPDAASSATEGSQSRKATIGCRSIVWFLDSACV